MKKINYKRSTLLTFIIALLGAVTIFVAAPVHANFLPRDYTYSDPEIITDYDYTILGIPDIQNITKWKAGTLSQMFMKLTTRAKQNKLAYTFSVGDLVQDPTDVQFQTARDAFAQFDDAGLPYAFVPGNHDYDRYTGDIPSDKSDTKLNRYFSYDDYKDMPTFGGARVVGNMVNTFHIFEAGGVEYLMMALEDAPTPEVLAWADDVISSFPNRRTIIVTHDYFLRPTGNSIPKSAPGEAVWEMAKKHANIFMIVCGHRSTLDPVFVMGTGDNGNKIMQIMICFQSTLDENGDNVPVAFFMRFNEAKKTINFSLINPVNDKLFNGNQFTTSFEDEKNPTVGLKSNTYTVTWRNFDGTVLETDQDVVENTQPDYGGSVPVKPADALNTYEFSGWTPEVKPATSDVTYIAEFTAVAKNNLNYTVYWMNYDGTVLELDNDVVAGSMPSFDGTDPTRASDETNSYTFAGWNPSVAPVTGDVIYTAQFIPKPITTGGNAGAGCGNASFALVLLLGALTVGLVPLFIRKSY